VNTSHRHLTREERYQTHALRKGGLSIRVVARAPDRVPSTVSRELRRDAGRRGYDPERAQRASERRLVAGSIPAAGATPEGPISYRAPTASLA